MRCWAIAAGGVLATALAIVWGLVLGYQLERDKREHEGAALWEAMYVLHRDAALGDGAIPHSPRCTPADCDALAALQDLA